MIDNQVSDSGGGCTYSHVERHYSHAQEFINNLPYITMIALGAVVLAAAFGRSALGWTLTSLYVAYGIVGALWIIVFLCPYCRYYGTRSCPCGYGSIAARLRDRKPGNRFNEKFKQHIPVIVPLWFIPAIAALPFLVKGFSWFLLVMAVLFALDAFLVLPLVSTKHGCKDCPQRDSCPWMAARAKAKSKTEDSVHR